VRQKGFTPILIVIIIALIAIAGAYYFGTNKGNSIPTPVGTPFLVATNSPTQTTPTIKPTANPTTNWLIYKDEINSEYSFMYPPSWYNYPRQKAPNGGYIEGKFFYNNKDIINNKDNIVTLSIQKGIWYEDPSIDRNTLVFKSNIGTLRTGGDILIKISDLTISGKPAVHYTDEYKGGQEPPGFESIYAIKRDNWVYQLDFYSPNKESVLNETETINNIISTFKFTQ